jgi:hypothetical protein
MMRKRWAIACSLLAALLGNPPRAAAEQTAEHFTSTRQLLREHPDALRRESAALVLGYSEDTASVTLLLDRLDQERNRWVRAAICEALGLLGDRSAAPALRGALAREKHPRVRRAVALALMRLGERVGVGELMWQLTSGNQHSRAEAMKALVRATGQPLGQDIKAWWRYFGRPLQQAVGRPPGGLLELRGLRNAAGEEQPRLQGAGSHGAWRQVCARRVRLTTRRDGQITAELLRSAGRVGKPLAGSCLLLLELTIGDAPPPPVASDAGSAKAVGPAVVPSSGLTVKAAEWLLQQRPRPAGIALAAPTREVARFHPEASRLLAGAGLLLIDGLAAPDRRLHDNFRMLLVPSKSKPARTAPLILGLLD